MCVYWHSFEIEEIFRFSMYQHDEALTPALTGLQLGPLGTDLSGDTAWQPVSVGACKSGITQLAWAFSVCCWGFIVSHTAESIHLLKLLSEEGFGWKWPVLISMLVFVFVLVFFTSTKFIKFEIYVHLQCLVLNTEITPLPRKETVPETSCRFHSLQSTVPSSKAQTSMGLPLQCSVVQKSSKTAVAFSLHCYSNSNLLLQHQWTPFSWYFLQADVVT